MKRYVVSLLLAAATPPAFAADVGVSVTSDSRAFTAASISAMRRHLY